MKPVVHYEKDSNSAIYKGAQVYLKPLDHPSDLVSNKAVARTSPVQAVFDDGIFETLNTRYEPSLLLQQSNTESS